MSLDAYGSLLGSVVPSCVDWRVVSFGACGRGCVDLGCANRGCWWVVGFVAWGGVCLQVVLVMVVSLDTCVSCPTSNVYEYL